MNNLKISTRLIILIGSLSMLLLFIGTIGLFGISKANDALKTVYEDRTMPMGQIADINRMILRNRLLIAGSLLNPVPQEIVKDTAEVDANIAAISKVWTDYMATTLTVEEARIAKKFADDRGQFVQQGLLPAVAALRGSDFDGAKRVVFEKIRPLYDPVKVGIDALMQLQIDVAKEEFNAAGARYDLFRWVSIAAIGSGILFAVFFGFITVRSITRQLGCEPGEAAEVAQSVSAGDLSVQIHLKPGDTTA